LQAICERLISEWNDTCVIMGCRSKERGEQAIQDIQKTLGTDVCKDRLELLVVDTSSTSSVQKAAGKLASKDSTDLYGIINNAGVSL
jgi:NAD(P)-dependent dehydrogenase (short-subunit alcohol dehydrogenase family)